MPNLKKKKVAGGKNLRHFSKKKNIAVIQKLEVRVEIIK